MLHRMIFHRRFSAQWPSNRRGMIHEQNFFPIVLRNQMATCMLHGTTFSKIAFTSRSIDVLKLFQTLINSGAVYLKSNSSSSFVRASCLSSFEYFPSHDHRQVSRFIIEINFNRSESSRCGLFSIISSTTGNFGNSSDAILLFSRRATH